MDTRKSAVAGQFYPSASQDIESAISHYNKILDEHLQKQNILTLKPKAVIVPHAGYIYSGFTANFAHRLLANSDLKRIVVIGPSHRVYLNGTSVSEYDTYETPFGNMKIDKRLVDEIKDIFSLHFIPEAHSEHSTEVQLPFINAYIPKASVVELVYGSEDPIKLSKIIDYLLKYEDVGIVISTDLSHYYDIDKANRLDSICLDAINKLDIEELHQGCEACGNIGVEAMLLSAKKAGLKPVLLDYRTSADASGDKSQVVGYMSAAFIEG